MLSEFDGFSAIAFWVEAETLDSGNIWRLHKFKEFDVEESYNCINTKINRRSFAFQFFLRCMKAIGVNLIGDGLAHVDKLNWTIDKDDT